MKDKRWIGYSPICVLGTSPWLVRQDGKWKFDVEGWKKHLAPIANAGANAVRILPFSVFGPRNSRADQFTPYVLDAATDKWDLSKFNDEYFPIVKQLIKAANDYGMTVWFCWFDHCSFIKGSWNEYNPWIYNIQKIGTIYDDLAGKYLQAFMRRTVEEFGSFDMGYHFANEAIDVRFPDMAKKYMFPLIKTLPITFDRMGYGSIMQDRPYLGDGKYADKPATVQDIAREHFGAIFGDKAKTMVMREVHGVGNRMDKDRPFGDRVAQAVCWWSKYPVGDFIVDTDGMKKGDSECDKDFDGARPSARTMYDMMTYLWKTVKNVKVHVFHCPQTVDTNCLLITFQALNKAYREGPGEGKDLDNYGKVVYVPPESTPVPPPDTPVPTPNPPHSWCKDNWGWLVLAGLALIAMAILL